MPRCPPPSGSPLTPPSGPPPPSIAVLSSRRVGAPACGERCKCSTKLWLSPVRRDRRGREEGEGSRMYSMGPRSSELASHQSAPYPPWPHHPHPPPTTHTPIHHLRPLPTTPPPPPHDRLVSRVHVTACVWYMRCRAGQIVRRFKSGQNVKMKMLVAKVILQMCSRRSVSTAWSRIWPTTHGTKLAGAGIGWMDSSRYLPRFFRM